MRCPSIDLDPLNFLPRCSVVLEDLTGHRASWPVLPKSPGFSWESLKRLPPAESAHVLQLERGAPLTAARESLSAQEPSPAAQDTSTWKRIIIWARYPVHILHSVEVSHRTPVLRSCLQLISAISNNHNSKRFSRTYCGSDQFKHFIYSQSSLCMTGQDQDCKIAQVETMQSG